jgi:hypothetical protein
MDNAEIGEAPEVPHIDGRQSADAMDIHACRQPGIVDLHALDVMHDQKRPRRSVSATLKPNPFLSSGRVEAFQNSPSVCEV